MKAVIDDHIQRLFDALLNSLRKAISTEVNSIDSFLKDAMETLSKRPQSVEEIGEANGKHAEFLKKKKEVKIKFFYKKVKGYGCAMNISNIVEIILQ